MKGSYFFVLTSLTNITLALRQNSLRNFFISTVTGVEDVLASELGSENIGARNIKTGKCGVYFQGDSFTAFNALIWSRTSLRLMEVILESTDIHTRDDLYSFVSSIDWSKYLSYHNTLKVDTTLGGDISKDLSHSHYTSLTVKNAVVDQFMDKLGKRPDVDIENPDLSLFLYIHRGKASLYRVWSGEDSMHKRGYRQLVHKAALRETTAATILKMTKWKPNQLSLCDPMCGSGTIAIEAALLATNTAPGILKYGPSKTFKDSTIAKLPVPQSAMWPDIDIHDWDAVWAHAYQKDRRADVLAGRSTIPLIMANDMHPGAVELAIRASAAAGVHKLISFACKDISEYIPKMRPDMIITNPPWDIRLEGAGESWYKLGNFARQQLQGGTLWALSGNAEVTRNLRMPATHKIPFSSSSMDLRLLRYVVDNDNNVVYNSE